VSALLAAGATTIAYAEPGTADVEVNRMSFQPQMRISETCLIEARPGKAVTITCSSQSRPFVATLVSDLDAITEQSLNFTQPPNHPEFVAETAPPQTRGQRLSVDY